MRKRETGFVVINDLVGTTKLSKAEINEIVRLYNVPTGSDNTIALGAFVQKLITHYRSTVTLKDLAEMFEITERQINELAKTGKLPKVVRDVYPKIDCVRSYVRLLRGQIEDGRGGVTKDAKNRLMIATAERQELKVAEQKKQVVSVSDLETVLSGAVVAVRIALVQGIKNVAKNVVGKNEAEVADLLNANVNTWLYDLSNIPKQLVFSVGDVGGDSKVVKTKKQKTKKGKK